MCLCPSCAGVGAVGDGPMRKPRLTTRGMRWRRCWPRPGAARTTALSGLIGERATRSETFRTWWAAHNVWLHRTGVKRLDLAPPRRSFPASGSPVLSQ